MARRRLDVAEYTVGWLCALPIDLAAAQVMLDEEHLPHDSVNSIRYTLGRVGNHNVVLACPPAGRIGISGATFSAAKVTTIFKSICFTLMVGVGGGVPSPETDVRLGDVVISQPVAEHSGVVQYDFGKTVQGGHMKRTGPLNAPSKILLDAVSQLKAYGYQTRLDKGSLAMHLSPFDRHLEFSRESAGPDTLFEASYHHHSGATCERCSKDRIIPRMARRAGEEVTIHYGTIASGNQLIKDGPTRDRLSEELGGLLCFEMEAAGIMNSCQCLVVRGIGNYADSHKNDMWQPYAASTAAACAKWVLSFVPAADVVKIAIVEDALKYRIPFDLKGVPIVGEFAEQPEDLKELEEALIQQGEPSERRLLVLYGLVGLDKTQLAASFARRHRNKFSSVLWLDGSNIRKLKQDFAEFASRIPAEQISETSRLYATSSIGDVDMVVKDVLSWLSRSDNNRWLMVIYNVDKTSGRRDGSKEAYDVEEFLPEADHGSVLITTCLFHLDRFLEEFGTKEFHEEQIWAALKALYTKDVSKCFINQRVDDLMKFPCGSPFALTQAAAITSKTGTIFDTQLRLHKKRRLKLADIYDSKRASSQSYSNGVIAMLWTALYMAVLQEDETAANLLLLWAHLDNNGPWHDSLATGPRMAERAETWLEKIAHSGIATRRKGWKRKIGEKFSRKDRR
ncbi:hypothetical protein E8E13_002423 [Curvularia kusanoi]|uniref:Nucleoside phosphorylase domain-containing protein n=1 Tax=Curvularia kusanoi TaxID=90978 RepID=A0A9P4TAP7_CURKU|nr:hypothetical protein E8E13_002423 [Curvularia kusanoi]